VFVVACAQHCAHAQSLMGVDLGSNEVKVATLKNSEFSIVLNEASKRKSVNALGFDGEERIFGEAAANLRGRLPKNVFRNAHHLLGVKAGSPVTKNFGTTALPVALETHNERGGVLMVANNMKLHPEEVVGHSLHYMAEMTKAYGKFPELSSCVVAVPPHFSAQARAAVVSAGDIAGLRVVAVVNDNAAVALRYGQERAADAKDETVLFIDVGSSFTSASVATFASIKGTPHVTIHGVAWDEELGGSRFDERVASHLAGLFDKQTGFKIRDNLKSYTKLMNAASKAKMQLSANEEVVVSIGSLMNDKDFQTKLTRKTLDELCGDLYARIAGPVKKVLADVKKTVGDMDHVVPFGGGWRIPGLQNVLKKEAGINKLETILNSDEAAAFGAAFIHGNHSGTLRVREIKLLDTTTPPSADAPAQLRGADMGQAKNKHSDMCQAEDDRKKMEAAKSGLEAWIYSIKEKCGEDEMEKVATDEEVTEVRGVLEAAEEWLYEEGEKGPLSMYANKKTEIQGKVSKVITRFDEFFVRPEALKALKARIQRAKGNARDWAKTRPHIPAKELEALAKLAGDTESWVADGETKLQGDGLKKDLPFTAAELKAKTVQIKEKEEVLLLLKASDPEL